MRSNCGSESAGQLCSDGVTSTKSPPARKTPDKTPRASGSNPARTSQISTSASCPRSVRDRPTPSDLIPSGAFAPIHMLVSMRSVKRGSIRARLQVSSPANTTQWRWRLAAAAARTPCQKPRAQSGSFSVGDRGDMFRPFQLAVTRPAMVLRRRPGRSGRVQSGLSSSAVPSGGNR